MMKDGIQTFSQHQVCVSAKEPLNQLLTESIPPFRVNPPLDRPAVLKSRILYHDTRNLVRKPGQLLEDGMSSAFVLQYTFLSEEASSFRVWKNHKRAPLPGHQIDDVHCDTMLSVEVDKVMRNLM